MTESMNNTEVIEEIAETTPLNNIENNSHTVENTDTESAKVESKDSISSDKEKIGEVKNTLEETYTEFNAGKTPEQADKTEENTNKNTEVKKVEENKDIKKADPSTAKTGGAGGGKSGFGKIFGKGMNWLLSLFGTVIDETRKFHDVDVTEKKK